ncbi:MAG: MBL fold metallo-hydrolase [Nitrospirae bacterium]|nr:MBL fold metallo-hydrolase [Nitrospirota bacterium]
MKIKSVLFFLASLLAAGGLVPATAQAGTLSIQPVVPDVWAVIGEDGNANAGFILTRDGVVVVDSQINPRAAEAMLRAIRKLTATPILYLINTHAHGDHTFANHVIHPTRGIIAHERTKVALATRGKQMLKEYPQSVGVKEAEGAKVTLPAITFTDQMTLPIADRTIVLRYLGIGHTVGDIVVWLPNERVLFSGDLVFVNHLPWLGEGETREWLKTLARLKTLPFEHLIPGSGPVGDRRSLDRFERYLSGVRRVVVEAFLKRQSLEQLKRTASFPEYSHDLKYREWLPLNLEHAYRQMEKER